MMTEFLGTAAVLAGLVMVHVASDKEQWSKVVGGLLIFVAGLAIIAV